MPAPRRTDGTKPGAVGTRPACLRERVSSQASCVYPASTEEVPRAGRPQGDRPRFFFSNSWRTLSRVGLTNLSRVGISRRRTTSSTTSSRGSRTPTTHRSRRSCSATQPSTASATPRNPHSAQRSPHTSATCARSAAWEHAPRSKWASQPSTMYGKPETLSRLRRSDRRRETDPRRSRRRRSGAQQERACTVDRVRLLRRLLHQLRGRRHVTPEQQRLKQVLQPVNRRRHR